MVNGDDGELIGPKYYDDFVRKMQAAGYIRKQKCIDENTTTIVATFGTGAGAQNARVAEITCPAGYIMTTKGTEQLTEGGDRSRAHAFTIRLAGTDDTELGRRQKLKFEIIKPFEDTKLITRDFYSMFTLTKQLGATATTFLDKADNEIYRWRRGFVLYTQEILRVSVVLTDIAIQQANVKLQADVDFWYKQI